MRSADEVRDVEVDRVDRRSGREILLERQGERDLRGERPATGRGIDRRAGIIAQPFHSQEFGRRRYRAVEAEARLRRRRLRERVGHLEHAVGDGELAAGRYFHIAAADIDHRRAAGNAQIDVGVANRRQAGDGADFRAVADDLDQQTVVGNRRAARLECGPRRVGRDVQPVDGAGQHMFLDPGADLRRRADRPQQLHRRDRHARAGNAEHQARIVAGKVEAAGERDTKIGVAQFARIEVDALLGGVDPHAQRDPVEDERLLIRWGGGGKHDRAARDLEAPHAASFARRVELREQGDAVAARQHLERHDQRLARRVPVEIDFGAIDRNAGERIIEIDDDALVHQDLALEHVRDAVGPDIGADARRQRQIGLELALAHAHGEHGDPWPRPSVPRRR